MIKYRFEKYVFSCLIQHLAVMMAAVIDITKDEQKTVVRRLLRESGNVNVKTPVVCFFVIVN